jgi:hypothetical protein
MQFCFMWVKVRRNFLIIRISLNLELRFWRFPPGMGDDDLRYAVASSARPARTDTLVASIAACIQRASSVLFPGVIGVTIGPVRLEAGIPTLVEAREIIVKFHMMIRRKSVAELASWIERARASLVASFASGVAKDEAAVRTAITLPWSNGQTEGQITRLKLVRRQMYGRGNIDLLQARLIGTQ